VEDDLAARLERARAQAGELVEAARRQAEEMSRAADEEAARLEADAAARIAEQRSREETVIRTEAKARMQGYDELAGTTVATLAEQVLELLLEETPA
jgi:hypothetical protein